MRRVIGDFVPDGEVDSDDPLVASGPAEQPNEELETPAAAFVRNPQIRAKGLQQAKQPQHLSYSAPSEGGEVEVKGGTVTTDATTRSPRWAATRSAPAGRARSTRCATAGPVVRPV